MMTRDERAAAIEELEQRLYDAQPKTNDDGEIGDGSHEHLASVFESCFDRVDAIARRAISLLKSTID